MKKHSSENIETLIKYSFEYFLYFSSANWNFHWRRKFCKNNQKDYEYRGEDNMGDGCNAKIIKRKLSDVMILVFYKS